MNIREQIFKTVDFSKKNTSGAIIYNIFIVIVIVVNLISVWDIIIYENVFLDVRGDIITACVTGLILLVDYILRWVTADFRLKIGRKSFLLYPFTLMAIFDLLAIIPVFGQVGNGLQLLKLLRFLPLFRKFNPAKFNLSNYTHGINEIATVIVRMKVPFIAAGVFVIFYIFFSALIMLFVEHSIFQDSFINALYWSIITCTSVGYGDVVPTTTTGRVITMISSLVSVIIIALPVAVVTAGITAGYLRPELRNKKSKHAKTSEVNSEHDIPYATDEIEEINYCPECGKKCKPTEKFCTRCGQKLK